jgi:putative tricarboxylic transport membrane protein
VRRADTLCAVALLAVAGVVVAEGVRLGLGWGSDGPQAGFFVFYLGLALGLGSVAVLGQAFLLGDPPLYRKPFVEPGQIGSVLRVLLPAAAMVLVTHWLGLYVAGALYVGAYMRWIGRHAWPTVVAVALAIPVVTFLIFEIWFLVPMPKGPLEAYLGY